MRWPALGALLLTAMAGGGEAQQTAADRDHDAVLAAVEAFFRTMTERDVEGARGVLEAEGRFFSVRVGPDGERSVRSFTNQSYLDGLADDTVTQVERIFDPVVHIHADVANVWARYSFHRSGTLSHCGVDSFDLIRTSDGWKITGGVYTVEPAGCPPPPARPPG